jgi:hypothetical protein
VTRASPTVMGIFPIDGDEAAERTELYLPWARRDAR